MDHDAVDGDPRPGAPAPEEPGAPDLSPARFEELARRPVAEHVAVFEDEHARLQRDLSAIDQL